MRDPKVMQPRIVIMAVTFLTLVVFPLANLLGRHFALTRQFQFQFPQLYAYPYTEQEPIRASLDINSAQTRSKSTAGTGTSTGIRTGADDRLDVPVDAAEIRVPHSGSSNNTDLHSLSTSNLRSKVVCREQNCLIVNACFDNGINRRQPLRLRLFGSLNHVDSQLRIMTHGTHPVIGFRENVVVLTGMQEVQQSRIPTSIAKNSTASVINRWVNYNCGHDLGDGAVALFRSMRLFPRTPDQLDRLFIVGKYSACDKVFKYLAKQVVTAVTKKNIKFPTVECYNRVYFGLKGISYMADHGTWENRAASLEADMRAFRDMSYRHARIDAHAKRDTILIMEKRKGKHFSNLANITEMAAYLVREFSAYHIKVVTWSDFDMEEQLALMSRTRAIISLPGSDIMNGIFLQDGSTLLLYCRIVVDLKANEESFDESNEMKFWYSRVSYINSSMEACNSTAVSYWKDGSEARTIVDFQSLKLRLQNFGI